MKKDPKRKGKPVAEREKSRPLHFTDTSKPTPQTSALEVRAARNPVPNMVWTIDQQQMIRDQYAKGATDEEFKVLMGVAAAKGLDPLRRQIYFRKQKEWDREANGYVDRWIWMTSIDGLRSIADRTGLYDGQDRPTFEYVEEAVPEGKPIKLLELALVQVWRKDITRPFVGEARYAEFVQHKADGTPNQMWQKMLHNQLAKCAEALALRKAFPDDCNLYVPEEFAKQDEESAGARYGGAAPAAAPAASRADHLAAEIEKCETTAACDELAQRMVNERLTGNERKVLGDLWKRQRDELEKGPGYARQ